MTILNCSNVSVAFGVDVLFENVSFSVEEGDKLAVIGVNGAGKTTLLKVITGEFEKTDGVVSVAREKTMGMLSQQDALDSEKTVYEEMLNVFSRCIRIEKRLAEIEKELSKPNYPEYLPGELSRLTEEYKKEGGYEYKNRTKSTLNRLGFGDEMFEKKISLLSGGQKTALALVRLLLINPDIIILDEPTNHLDMASIAWLEDYLKKLKRTVIVVSHDRYFLDKVTNKTLELENGKAVLYPCAYSEYRVRKEKDREIAEKHYKTQQKEIARLREYIEQQRRWNRERNIIAAESREKAIERMVKVEKPEDEPDSLRFSFKDVTASGNDVLSVKDLTMGFNGRELFRDLSFEVKRNERFFIIGRNGCGKSTLLKLLMNKFSPIKGKITFGYNCRVGYYDQESQGLDPNNTVLSELWNDEKVTETEIRSLLAIFMFKGEDVFKEVSVLSGGERARLTLAKLFSNKINVLILDEPTNHLDIKSREALENALKTFNGTIIAVSHDRYFIKCLADHIFEIGGEALADFKGSYDDYSEKRSVFFSEENDASSEEKSVSLNKLNYLKAKEDRAKEKKRIRDVEKAEKRITELEERLEAIADEEIQNASDYKKLSALSEERQAIDEEMETLYAFLDENT